MRDILDIQAIEKEETPAVQGDQASKPRERRTLTLEEIIDTATRLRHILTAESQYLDVMDFKSVAHLQEEKNKLITALEIQKKILKLDPTIKANFPREAVNTFKQSTENFDNILGENYRQLLRIKEINRKVVEVIAKAAAGRGAGAATYGKNGAVAPQSLSDMPLALRQSI